MQNTRPQNRKGGAFKCFYEFHAKIKVKIYAHSVNFP